MTARPVHQGLGRRFLCNDRKHEGNKWYLLLENIDIFYVRCFAFSLALQTGFDASREITYFT